VKQTKVSMEISSL